MRVAKDGKSISMTLEEAIKLYTIGFVTICKAGKVIAIVEEGKEDSYYVKTREE